jgi:protein-tyrosine-phosphatase
MYGQRAYVQSAGVKNDMEIDGFSIAVCKELGIELSPPPVAAVSTRCRNGAMTCRQFDLIVALSPRSQRRRWN